MNQMNALQALQNVPVTFRTSDQNKLENMYISLTHTRLASKLKDQDIKKKTIPK